MKRSIFRVIISICLLYLGVLWADDRLPYDIILVIDKSLSMEEEIGVVKDFVADSIIDKNIIIGDNLVIIAFYGKAEVSASFPINSTSDLEKAKNALKTINLNKLHTHTDIGNALDLAQTEVQKFKNTERNKIIMMVTDGIQEAPPGSKYYSPDGTFSHALLDKATTIAKEGWKIHVINIGSSQISKEFTERISGQYTEISENLSQQELAQATEEFRGFISISEKPENLVVPGDYQSTLKIKLKSQQFKADTSVTVKEIRLSSPIIQDYSVLNNPVTFSIPKEGESEISFKLSFPVSISPGDYQVDLQFVFGEGQSFSPGVISLNLHVNSFIENNLVLVILLIVAGLLIICLLVWGVIKLLKSRGIKFRLKVEEQPLKPGKDVFKVNYGSWLYLNESYGYLSLTPKRGLRSIARLYGVKDGLEFEVLREEHFMGLKTGRQNILGKTIKLKTQDGQIRHLEFIRL